MKTLPWERMEPFPTTHWSEVSRTSAKDSGVSHEALEQFLRRYLPALRMYLVSHRKVASDQIDDLLQGFVCDQILDGQLLDGAQASNGRLRTLLRLALDRHVFKVRRHAHAVKRGGRASVSSYDDESFPISLLGHKSADAFDVAWARQVVADALSAMKSRCAAEGRLDVWTIFESRMVAPLLDDAPKPSYSTLVATFGLESPGQASNLLVTAKRMFVRSLEVTIAQYEPGDSVHDELRTILQILSVSK